jgi:hypothetical protein
MKLIKNIFKLYKLLNLIEFSKEGDLLIKSKGSLLLEGDYIVLSTERKSREQLKDIKSREQSEEINIYGNTQDGVMHRTSSPPINTPSTYSRSSTYRM